MKKPILKNKNSFKVILIPIFLLLLSSFTYADFWENHLRDSEIALQTPSTNDFYRNIIKGNEDVYLAANAITDCTVIWYLREQTRTSYQQSHVRRAYEKCNELAGNDNELKTFCLGMGTHHTQDALVSHGYKDVKGYTPDCIEKYWGSNILLHVACENRMTQLMLSQLNPSERERIILKAGNAYDLIEDENPNKEGYQNKFMDLASASFGFTTPEQKESFVNACVIVGSYVKKGQGSGYLQIYEDNRNLPNAWIYIPLIIILLSILLSFVAIKIGNNNWKWILVAYLVAISLVMIMFLIAMSTGYAFAWFRSFANFLPTILWGLTLLNSSIGLFIVLKFKNFLKYTSSILFAGLILFSLFVLLTNNFGIIDIPNWEQHRQKSVDETVKFLDTGILAPLDASGLDFVESGVVQKGNLVEAESRFDYIKWFLLSSLGYLIVVLIIQMKKK